MAVTPLVAPSRVTIHYHVDGLSHKFQPLCEAFAGGTDPSGFNFITRNTTPDGVDAAVQALAARMATVLPSSNATIDAYDLEQYSGGAYIVQYSGTIGISGSNAAGRSTYNRLTTVFRDENLKLVRSVLMGVSLVAPQRGGQGAATGVFGTYFHSFVSTTALDPGNWIKGRSSGFLVGATFYTVSLDRKSRRRAGLL